MKRRAAETQAVEKPSGLLTLDEARTRLGISIPQAAHLLGVSSSAAYSMFNRGELPGRRIANSRCVVSVPGLLSMFGASSAVAGVVADEAARKGPK